MDLKVTTKFVTKRTIIFLKKSMMLQTPLNKDMSRDTKKNRKKVRPLFLKSKN